MEGSKYSGFNDRKPEVISNADSNYKSPRQRMRER